MDQMFIGLDVHKDSIAVASDLSSFFTRETLDRVCASRKLGTAIAARIAMIATTISNSIRVKPDLVDRIKHLQRKCDE